MARQYPPSPDEIRLWELASGNDNKTTNWDEPSMREYLALVEKLSGGSFEVKKRGKATADRVCNVLQGTEAA